MSNYFGQAVANLRLDTIGADLLGCGAHGCLNML